jgi:anti-sigma regulatory factor (Ser/Thr protein kinase)
VPDVQCEFDDQLTELVAARRFTEGVLGEHDRLDDVLVVVSELASNAVRHARSGFTLSIDGDEDRIRIQVTDRGGGWPVAVEVRVMPCHGGMGLKLVDALADRWGAVEHPPGKLVWAEIDEPSPHAGRSN